MSPANDGIEDTDHFCCYGITSIENRRNLLAGVNNILKAYGKPEVLNDNVLQILLQQIKAL